MTLPIAAILPVAAGITAALDGWRLIEADMVSLYRRDWEWVRAGEQVHLSTWDSSSRATVMVSYDKGGAQLAYLVLTDTGQVLPWLRLVGAVRPTVRELAEALVVAS